MSFYQNCSKISFCYPLKASLWDCLQRMRLCRLTGLGVLSWAPLSVVCNNYRGWSLEFQLTRDASECQPPERSSQFHWDPSKALIFYVNSTWVVSGEWLRSIHRCPWPSTALELFIWPGRARKYSENIKDLKTLAIEQYCFMNREYIGLDELLWRVHCKEINKGLLSPWTGRRGADSQVVAPGLFLEGSSGSAAWYFLCWRREMNAFQDIDVSWYILGSFYLENYIRHVGKTTPNKHDDLESAPLIGDWEN